LDLLHLLFYLCHNVWTKDNPFAKLGSAQWCVAGSSIEFFER
jgi:hypothetical protein